MAFTDHDAYQPPIEADFESLTPLYDFVLVKELHSVKAGSSAIIIDPNIHMTKDYRWRRDRPTGLRRGTVVAVGRGDKNHVHGDRHGMNVRPGDEVIYPRIPANDILLNGQEYTFCHEEQHILAVLEP